MLRFAPLLRLAARPAAFRPSARLYSASAAPSKADITERIIGVLKGFDKVDAAKITPTASFVTDLGLDSLDTVEVTMAIEEEFNIELTDEEAESITSVGAAVEKIASNPNAI